MANDTQVAIRLPREAVARAGRLSKRLAGLPAYAAWRLTPAGVMRLAMLKGLDALEAEAAEAKRGGR
jgi:predicted DNA-binding protein